MNRFAKGILAGGLMGVVAAGTMMIAGRRRQRMLAEMKAARMFRNRARRTLRSVKDGALRFGSALKYGTSAFADRMQQKGSWGRT